MPCRGLLGDVICACTCCNTSVEVADHPFVSLQARVADVISRLESSDSDPPDKDWPTQYT
eukprot:3284330-Pleurochrysis_carterae.AAC.2